MNFFYLICALCIFNSCAVKKNQTEKPMKIVKVKVEKYISQSISDLKTVPQDVSYYTKNLAKSSSFSQETYEKQYFRVWNLDKVSIALEDAKWAHDTYKVGNTYGENLQLHKELFFQKNLDNANYKQYSSVNKKALTLVNVNLRTFPTNKPVFFDPKKAGEGFPFDYLQNSSIAANKPLILSHYSKNGKWAFVESSFAFGWVKTRNIVVIDEKYTKLWQYSEQVFIIEEGVPIYSQDKEFLFKSRIGMMLPLVSEDEETYTVLTVSKYKNKNPLYIQSKIEKRVASKGVLDFNAKNIDMILKEISKTNYGWGGIFGQRDCSSTLRDFYAPFGLWLPRNSSQQSKLGKFINLEVMSEEEKRLVIKKEAIAFRTLVYKQGHIALYVGQFNNQAIIFQNVWGIKTKKDGVEGRFIIGRPIFSTLEVGKNLKAFDTNTSMLIKLKSISTL